MNVIESINEERRKPHVDEFDVGDTVRVHIKIREGARERVQVFEGAVIRRNNAAETFTVRRVAFGEGVERIFPIQSPRVEKIEVVRHGKVKRAKLYYLRDRAGKAARIKRGPGPKKRKQEVQQDVVQDVPIQDHDQEG